jgi:hypothetical protein
VHRVLVSIRDSCPHPGERLGTPPPQSPRRLSRCPRVCPLDRFAGEEPGLPSDCCRPSRDDVCRTLPLRAATVISQRDTQEQRVVDSPTDLDRRSSPDPRKSSANFGRAKHKTHKNSGTSKHPHFLAEERSGLFSASLGEVEDEMFHAPTGRTTIKSVTRLVSALAKTKGLPRRRLLAGYRDCYSLPKAGIAKSAARREAWLPG